MATTHEETNSLVNQSQFQQIDEIIATAAQQTSASVVVVLDIDGVQEGARVALEDKLFKHFRNNLFFVRWFNEECLPKFLLILERFTLDGIHFPLMGLSYEEKIKALLSYSQEECNKAFQIILASPDAPYRLIFLNLQKKLAEKKEDHTAQTIKIYLQTQTAFVCAMHLSAAVCIGDDLLLGEPGEQAHPALEQLYQKYQHTEQNKFLLFNLTSRTPAMAHVFKLQLDRTFGETTIHSLEEQQLVYNHNEELLPHYTTCATGNVIAASRHKKHKVTYSFLLQNNLLEDLPAHPLSIIFVDDKQEYLDDMQQLANYYAIQTETLPQNHIRVIPFHFSYNKSTNTILSYVDKKFNTTSSLDLALKIQDYVEIAEKIQDPDAKEVVLQYVRPFLFYLATQVSASPINAFGAEYSSPTLSTAASSFVAQPSGHPVKKQKRSHETELFATLTLTPTS